MTDRATLKAEFDEVNIRYKAQSGKLTELQFAHWDLRHTRVSAMTPEERAAHEAVIAENNAAIKMAEAELNELGEEWTKKRDRYLCSRWTIAQLYFQDDVRGDLGL